MLLKAPLQAPNRAGFGAFRALTCLAALLLPAVALAQRDTTADALARVEEALQARLGDGSLTLKEVSPVLVVSTAPAFEETKSWYPTAALATLSRVFGSGALRVCEACTTPRTWTESGSVEQNSGPPDVEELIRLDDNGRGAGLPARTAVWLDETPGGVTLRVVDLRNSHLLFAQNFDPRLTEQDRSHQSVSLTQELERRRRGDALVHIFFDATLYPSQRVALDFSEQWGDFNRNLSGVTASLLDPVLGLGAHYYRVIPEALNLMLGVEVVMSVPTGLISALTHTSTAPFDPLMTGVFQVRLPIGRTNYGVIASVSTNGKFGLGVTLMNFNLLPFLP